MLAGVISGVYRFWTKPTSHERNHDRLVRTLAWISNTPWIDYVRAGVSLILRIMVAIYGSARSEDGKIGSFFTVKAWKMSAWIAASYYFFLFPLGFVIGLVVILTYENGLNISDATFSMALLGVLFAVGWGFWRALIAIRRPVQRAGPRDSFASAIVQAPRGMLPFVAICILSLITGLGFEPPIARLFFGGLVVCLAYSVIRAIAVHGPLAPVQLAIQFLVWTLLFVALAMGLDVLQRATRAGDIGLIFKVETAFAVVGAIGALACCVYALTPRPRIRLQSALVALSALSLFATFDAGSASELGIAKVVLGLGFAYLIPMAIFVCGVIFASAVPDWASVGVTRYVLTRAKQSPSLSRMGLWLGLNIGTGLACALGALLILGATSLLAEGVARHIGAWTMGEDGKVSTAWLAILDGPRLMVWMLYERMAGDAGASSAVSVTAKNAALAAYAFFLASLLSLLPILLSASVLVTQFLARFLAFVVGQPVEYLHSTLLLPEDSTAEQRALSYGKTAIVFGVTGAFACVVVQGALSLLRH